MPAKKKFRKTSRKRTRIPPKESSAHKKVSFFKSNKLLLIWLISLLAVIAIVLFFSLPYLAGLAFYSGAEKTAGIVELKLQAADVPFNAIVKTNIGSAQTIGVKFVLDLPAGTDCTKVSTIKSSLGWTADDGFIENKAECKDGKIYFEQLILDAINAKTKEFEVATINFNGLKIGDYELKFSKFMVYDLVTQSYVIEKGEAAIVKVAAISPTAVKDCGTDAACFAASVEKCELAKVKSVQENENLLDNPQSFLPKEGLSKKTEYELNNLLVPSKVKLNSWFEVKGMESGKCSIDVTFEIISFLYSAEQETKLLGEGILKESLASASSLFSEEMNFQLPIKRNCKVSNIAGLSAKLSKNLGLESFDSEDCVDLSVPQGALCSDPDFTNKTTLSSSLEIKSVIQLNGKKYEDICSGNTVREWLCTDDCVWVQSASGNEGYLCFASDPNIFVSYVDVPCGSGSVCENGMCVKKAIQTQEANVQAPSGGGGGGKSCKAEWQCGSWSYCNSTLQQSRVCYDVKCKNKPKTEVRKCTSCDLSWVCGTWTNKDNQCGTRKCVDEHSCGVITGKPVESKTCPLTEQKAYVSSEGEEYYSDDGWEDSVSSDNAETIGVSVKYKQWIIGGLGGILILVIIVIVVIYLISKKKVDYNYDELKEWISKEREAGSTDSEIRKTLLNETDWTNKDIDKEFKELK